MATEQTKPVVLVFQDEGALSGMIVEDSLLVYHAHLNESAYADTPRRVVITSPEECDAVFTDIKNKAVALFEGTTEVAVTVPVSRLRRALEKLGDDDGAITLSFFPSRLEAAAAKAVVDSSKKHPHVADIIQTLHQDLLHLATSSGNAACVLGVVASRADVHYPTPHKDKHTMREALRAKLKARSGANTRGQRHADDDHRGLTEDSTVVRGGVHSTVQRRKRKRG